MFDTRHSFPSVIRPINAATENTVGTIIKRVIWLTWKTSMLYKDV